jgi:hypothetical protein
MRRLVSVLSAAAVLTATTVATAVPAFAQTPGEEEEFVPDISVRSGQPGDPVWGYLTVSDGCVDFFGALDVPGHTSDSSNEFQGPVCLF